MEGYRTPLRVPIYIYIYILLKIGCSHSFQSVLTDETRKVIPKEAEEGLRKTLGLLQVDTDGHSNVDNVVVSKFVGLT